MSARGTPSGLTLPVDSSHKVGTGEVAEWLKGSALLKHHTAKVVSRVQILPLHASWKLNKPPHPEI